MKIRFDSSYICNFNIRLSFSFSESLGGALIQQLSRFAPDFSFDLMFYSTPEVFAAVGQMIRYICVSVCVCPSFPCEIAAVPCR